MRFDEYIDKYIGEAKRMDVKCATCGKKFSIYKDQYEEGKGEDDKYVCDACRIKGANKKRTELFGRKR